MPRTVRCQRCSTLFVVADGEVLPAHGDCDADQGDPGFVAGKTVGWGDARVNVVQGDGVRVLTFQGTPKAVADALVAAIGQQASDGYTLTTQSANSMGFAQVITAIFTKQTT